MKEPKIYNLGYYTNQNGDDEPEFDYNRNFNSKMLKLAIKAHGFDIIRWENCGGERYYGITKLGRKIMREAIV